MRIMFRIAAMMAVVLQTPLHAQEPTPEQAVEFIKAAFSCPQKPKEILSYYHTLTSDEYVGDDKTLRINASYASIHSDSAGGFYTDAVHRTYYEARFSDIAEVNGFETSDADSTPGITFVCKDDRECFTNGGQPPDRQASFYLCETSIRDDTLTAFRVLLKMSESD